MMVRTRDQERPRARYHRSMAPFARTISSSQDDPGGYGHLNATHAATLRLEKFFEGENGVCFGWVKADFGAPRSVQGEDSTAVLSGTPLPHPSTAAPAHPPYPRVPVAPVQPASAHSAASLDPRCSVGRLARFRQEGGLVYLPYCT